MIHRKFNNLKFTRTYIGGSKQRENEIFTNVQGEEEDNSQVDWFEYRRVFKEYSDDILNIVLSWKYLTNVLSIGFAGLALLISFINAPIGILIFGIAVALHLTFQYFKHKEKKTLSAHDFSFDIILSAIKKQTGFEFDKN